MSTMTISMPEPMREFIESEVARGDYGSASELFREMVRERQKRHTQERLETLLLEGLESGDSIEVTPEYRSKRRENIIAMLKERSTKK